MKHSFIPSHLNSNLCASCHKTELDHTDKATCECCDTVGPCELYIDILMCPVCYDNEVKAQLTNNHPAKQEERVLTMNNLVAEAKKLDEHIEVASDIFTAETISIGELKKVIECVGYNTWHPKNEQKNTNFELSLRIHDRFVRFQNAIFARNKETVRQNTEDANRQKAIQIYLNNLAVKLRTDEREAIKLRDIDYKPILPKTIKPKVPKVKKVKFDRAELNRVATELGVELTTLQAIVVAKGCSVTEAGEIIKGMMK